MIYIYESKQTKQTQHSTTSLRLIVYLTFQSMLVVSYNHELNVDSMVRVFSLN